MFRKNSTFLFVLLGTISTVLALYFSLLLAAILLPSDVLYQLISSLIVFLFCAASLLVVVASRFAIGKEAQGKNFKKHVLVGSVAINLILLLIAFSLIYFGYATPFEALIICSGMLVFLLFLFKKFVLG